MSRPNNLFEITISLTELFEMVNQDESTRAQVKEGANALGKAIQGCKTHLEACKISNKQPIGEWDRFLHESPEANN
jgi:hypothetical protein